MSRCLSCALFVTVCVLVPGYRSNAPASENCIFKGVITDTTGKPVEGASVYVYKSSNTRRAPDFISPKSDDQGRFSINLLRGHYWVVARASRDDQRGPLSMQDKHSGEPIEVEMVDGIESRQDFVVASIREIAGTMRKIRSDYITISGYIIDQKKVPIRDAYVVAYRSVSGPDMPDYLSAWTDEEGRYSLALPPGTYCIGAARVFPPSRAEARCREISLPSNRKDMDVVAAFGEE